MNRKSMTPYVATHPGQLIKDELRERRMTQRQLADLAGIRPSVVSETIHGKRNVSLTVAIGLEKAFGIPVDMWMNMQTNYDLDTAAIAKRDKPCETVKVTIPVSDRKLLKEVARKFGWACL